MSRTIEWGEPVVCRDTSHSVTNLLCTTHPIHDNWDCIFQDMEQPKTLSILRDPNPSLGMICPGEPHQCHPNAPKFEDRSQEETEWQEQGARETAWKLAKSVFKLKEHERAAFFSSPENRCHLASTLKTTEKK